MTALTNYVFEEHLVRVIERNGEPWFVGKDVCAVLGIKDHAQALDALDDDEKGGYTIPTIKGEREAICISAPGIHNLAFRSRKPEAKRFRRWVTHEVLPAILKTGRYEIGSDGNTSAGTPYPVDETTRKLAVIQEARMTKGPAFAARLWDSLGMPQPPREIAPPVDRDALACLRHLLAAPAGGATVGELLRRAFLADRDAASVLKTMRIELRNDGFTVPIIHERLAAIFQDTPWPRAFEHLRKLPGSKPFQPLGGTRAGEVTFIPSVWIDG